MLVFKLPPTFSRYFPVSLLLFCSSASLSLAGRRRILPQPSYFIFIWLVRWGSQTIHPFGQDILHLLVSYLVNPYNPRLVSFIIDSSLACTFLFLYWTHPLVPLVRILVLLFSPRCSSFTFVIDLIFSIIFIPFFA
ncbi:hypothetical protein BDR07DRAFT_1402381 [Suillus spraguei]|nr:hypothetical protein BDR07DRAFT_1402381 [Suillus spraguei]